MKNKRKPCSFIKEHRVTVFVIASYIIIAALSYTAVKLSIFKDAMQTIMADMFLLLAASAVSMYSELRISVKKTLYSYRNIGLAGGILFTSVFAVTFLCEFFASLKVNTELMTWNYVYYSFIGFPRKFSYYAVFVICMISLLIGISNIALIKHEGFRLHNALSVIFAGFFIGGTVFIYFLSDFLEKKVLIPRGIDADSALFAINASVSLFMLVMLCYFECIFAGCAILGWISARKTPALNKDYIIILGCSIDKKGGLLPLLKGRVNRAVRFAWEQEIATGKPVKYVPSGGKGPNEVMSEGSAMELYLMTKGAEDYEIFPEKNSSDTYENMCFSKKIIDGMKENSKVAFATTNYHILRSGILAQKAGLDAEGVAGDTKWYFWPNGFIREFFAILAMNIKAHITAAAVCTAVCAAIGIFGYFGHLM